MKHSEISESNLADHLLWNETELKRGDWVYSPGEVHTAGTPHNIFQYDERINYSLHFGHELKFYKLESKEQKSICRYCGGEGWIYGKNGNVRKCKHC